MERKTHCKHGHEFTPENTITRKNGRRRCRQCSRDWQHNTKTRIGNHSVRRANLRFYYNLTPDEYEVILKQQSGRCANPTCGVVESPTSRLYVDHDHSCCPGRRSCGKCIRGLLCLKCNSILGFVDDTTERLDGLAEYIKSWKA